MKSWKTTVLGIIAILGVVSNVVSNIINNHPVDWMTTIAGISAGWGLIHAKDSQVTGGTIQQ